MQSINKIVPKITCVHNDPGKPSNHMEINRSSVLRPRVSTSMALISICKIFAGALDTYLDSNGICCC